MGVLTCPFRYRSPGEDCLPGTLELSANMDQVTVPSPNGTDSRVQKCASSELLRSQV
jgi:hypothetical protein